MNSHFWHMKSSHMTRLLICREKTLIFNKIHPFIETNLQDSLNNRIGEVEREPKGIDPSWNYNPESLQSDSEMPFQKKQKEAHLAPLCCLVVRF
ncbi:hypothetical protein BCT30_04970 [Enterovibrio norvegicus]|nr:hypothetical protein BCU46_22280 [Enterovibrio norvegicus]PMN44252.1 hypothetical protein BCT30_04970 [Enterovibrio norvegicus]